MAGIDESGIGSHLLSLLFLLLLLFVDPDLIPSANHHLDKEWKGKVLEPLLFDESSLFFDALLESLVFSLVVTEVLVELRRIEF